MTHEPTRALAIGALAIAITLMICGVIPDQPRAQASSQTQIIQTATPGLPTMPAPAPLAPVLVDQPIAPVVPPPPPPPPPPILLAPAEPIAIDAPITIDQAPPQFVPEAPADIPNAVPQCANGVDNPICDLPVLVLSNDAPAPAPVITDRDRAYSRARTR